MDKSSLSRRERILFTTIEIIDERGLHGLSIREIAEREGITKGAIYRHFKNKQEIILEVLNYYYSLARKIEKQIKEENIDPKEGIQLIATAYAEWHEAYPPISTLLISREIFRYDTTVQKRTSYILHQRIAFFVHLVKCGQKQGSISEKFSSDDFLSIVIGVVRSITLEWRLNDCQFPLKEKVLSIVKTLLEV